METEDFLSGRYSPRSLKSHKLFFPKCQSEIDFEKVIPLTNEDVVSQCDVKDHRVVNFPDYHLLQLIRARVSPLEGDVITEDGELFADISPRNYTGKTHNALLKKSFRKGKTLDGITLNLVSPFSDNYYHWMLDAIPVLLQARNSIKRIDQILVKKKAKFVIESLNILGFNRDQIYELREEVICSRLFTVSTNPRMHPLPYAPTMVKEAFSGSRNTNKAFRRIYLSRKDGLWRGVQNEAEVSQFLAQHGFETIELSQLTLTKQIETLSQASHVISAHGAGLTNIVFCNSGTQILEVLPQRWTPVCFMSLAQQVGCHYTFINAEPLGLTKSQVNKNKKYVPTSGDAHGQAMKIPIDKLKLFCERL